MADATRKMQPPRSRPSASRLFAPIDIASLVYFRIAFGGIMLWEVYRYLAYGRIARYFLVPEFHFKYLGFGWVQAWPGDGLYYHFFAMGVLAVFIMAGFLYRLSALLFFLAFTYVFLLEQAQYLNHFYFVSLVSFLMIFVPAHRTFSVDAWMRPALRSKTAPIWALWVLQAQMGFVYIWAGVAKLNGDWLRGYPLRDWLESGMDLPVVGPYMTEPVVAVGMSYGGLFLDLFVWPALVWRRTRPFAFAAVLAFHLLNAAIFNIGIFPWFSIAATLLFFGPDWPRRLLRRPAIPVPALPVGFPLGPRERVAATAIAAFIAVQVLVPMRQFAYPGNVSWTEEGHRYSWHQKLRSKRAFASFLLTDPSTGKTWEVDPRRLLTRRQNSKMAKRPYMIVQFAHHLSDLATEPGQPRIEVRVAAMASLNGRQPQPLIDPKVDLAAEPRTFFKGYDWIMPLQVPLHAQWDGTTAVDDPGAIAAIEQAGAGFKAVMGERDDE